MALTMDTCSEDQCEFHQLLWLKSGRPGSSTLQCPALGALTLCVLLRMARQELSSAPIRSVTGSRIISSFASGAGQGAPHWPQSHYCRPCTDPCAHKPQTQGSPHTWWRCANEGLSLSAHTQVFHVSKGEVSKQLMVQVHVELTFLSI